MPTPIRITGSKQLVVEGRDMEEFFKALLGKMDLANVQVQKPGDISNMGELWGFLRTLRAALSFAQKIDMQNIAQGTEENAFQRLLSALRSFSDGMGLADVQVQDFGGVGELGSFLRALQMQDEFAIVESLGIVRDAEEQEPTDAFRSVCGALGTAGLTTPSQIERFEGSNPRVGILILPDSTTKGMLETLCLRSVVDSPVMECIDEYFDCVKQQLGSLPRNMSKAKIQAFLASTPEPVLHLRWAVHREYWPWDSPAFDHVRQFLSNL